MTSKLVTDSVVMFAPVLSGTAVRSVVAVSRSDCGDRLGGPFDNGPRMDELLDWVDHRFVEGSD
jgi:hypothetical protein